MYKISNIKTGLFKTLCARKQSFEDMNKIREFYSNHADYNIDFI